MRRANAASLFTPAEFTRAAERSSPLEGNFPRPRPFSIHLRALASNLDLDFYKMRIANIGISPLASGAKFSESFLTRARARTA